MYQLYQATTDAAGNPTLNERWGVVGTFDSKTDALVATLNFRCYQTPQDYMLKQVSTGEVRLLPHWFTHSDCVWTYWVEGPGVNNCLTPFEDVDSARRELRTGGAGRIVIRDARTGGRIPHQPIIWGARWGPSQTEEVVAAPVVRPAVDNPLASGVKHDHGKPDYTLLPGMFFKRLGEQTDSWDFIGLVLTLTEPDTGAEDRTVYPVLNWLQIELEMETPKGIIDEVVKVLEYGAKKYAVDNWKRVPDAEKRYRAAARRHAIETFGDIGAVDEESGLPHWAHALCCIMFLVWFDEQRGNP